MTQMMIVVVALTRIRNLFALIVLFGLYRFLTGQQTTLWKRVQRRADSFDMEDSNR